MITAGPLASVPEAPVRVNATVAGASRGLGGELAVARVDLGAIGENTRWFAARASGAALMAVVKADGFGHGAVPVARSVLAAGAAWLGVARTREALALRAAGIDAPILAWLLEPGLVRAAVDNGVDLSVSSVDDLRRIAEVDSSRRAFVHLKLDTGLHRAGAAAETWAEVVGQAARLEGQGRIRVRGIWSHLSHGDVLGHPNNVRQRDALCAGVEVAGALGVHPTLTHLANSGGVIQIGASGCSMVRVGAGLYGIDVFHGRNGPSQLRPAMTITARIVGIRRVRAGEGIGYGHTTLAARDTNLALIPLGYADGLPRVAGAHGSLWCRSRRVPLVGRISMDQCSVDVGDLPVTVGEPVTVVGDGTDGAPTVADWADWAGTIPHEILAHIGSRVPRQIIEAD